jgi:hypothetical protein
LFLLNLLRVLNELSVVGGVDFVERGAHFVELGKVFMEVKEVVSEKVEFSWSFGKYGRKHLIEKLEIDWKKLTKVDFMNGVGWKLTLA